MYIIRVPKIHDFSACWYLYRLLSVVFFCLLTLTISCGKEELKELDKEEADVVAEPPVQEKRISIFLKDYCPEENYELVDFFAVNLSAQFHQEELQMDFDRDGLVNVVEVAGSGKFNIDIKVKDSNDDGYSDLLVYLAGFDNASQHELKYCENPGQDSDLDGLTDCEENNVLHTNYMEIDSDNDGISDYLEVRNGMNPLDENDTIQDLDGDGVLNAEEIRMNTPTGEENTEKVTERAFKYHLQMEQEEEQLCQDISITNIELVNAPNGNLFNFYFVERNKLTRARLNTLSIALPRNQAPGTVLEYFYEDLEGEQ